MLAEELSLGLLRDYVRSEREHREAEVAEPAASSKHPSLAGGVVGMGRFALRCRFPVALWPDAEEFFS